MLFAWAMFRTNVIDHCEELSNSKILKCLSDLLCT